MYLLLIVSFIWAFSFGLIKVRFAGVDPTAVTALRLAFALVLFLPFYRRRGLAAPAIARTIAPPASGPSVGINSSAPASTASKMA